MTEQTQLTEQESLAIITTMINKAKCDYEETGISALMWGCVIGFCSLVTFMNFWWHQSWAAYIWFLTAVAVIPQIMINARERKRRKYRTYSADAMGGIWISFAIGIFMLAFYVDLFHVDHSEPIFIIFYGIPTFSTGLARQFKPMTYGGIACWILAGISMFLPSHYTMLLTAGAALVAWFIPGLILRKTYLRLKTQNV
jgi:hypothetical protein